MAKPCSYDNGTGRAPLYGDFESCWISSDGSFCWAHGQYIGRQRRP